MPAALLSLAPVSAAASSARRLSQRSTEELVRHVIARIVAAPSRLAEIIADYIEPLIVFTADRRISAANLAAECFFGYGRGELAGKPTDDLVPVRLRQPDAPPMQAFDTLTTVEIPGLRRDGTEPHVSWTFGTAVTPPDLWFVMVVRDRAEIDDALEALYASEQRFRLLVEGVRDHAFILLDANGSVATWNSGSERIQDWRADEIIGKPYETFFSPEDRASGLPAGHLRAAAERGNFIASGWRVRKDGTRFYAEMSLWPLCTADGVLQGYAEVTHDLTAKRAAEEAERRLDLERAAREAAEAGRDRLERLHRAAQALSRSTTSEEVVRAVLGECLHEVDAPAGVIFTLDDDRKALRFAGEQGHSAGFLQGAGAIPIEARVPACDVLRSLTPKFFESAEACVAEYPELEATIRGSELEASVTLPLIARDTALGVMVVRYRQRHTFTDADRSLLLTIAELCAQALDRAKLFEAALRARADAEAANRAKDEFLAMLGHELRNPLAPITTAIELMKMRGETHSLKERDVIERQLGHISRLVDDLLDISRITRGKLELARRSVEIADAIARGVEMASPLLEQRHHHVALDVPRGLIVNGDPARLGQVVSNLLTNAAKYTSPGGHVSVEARAAGDAIVIRVRDDGAGIPSDLLPHVFDLFVQGKRTFDRSEGGLGIGLALVKNLVAMHGGTVAATSAGVPGLGSEFTVHLPRAAALTADDVRIRAPAAEKARGHKRVLVVDDNRDFAEMLASSLAALGYQVSFACDAVSALDVLRDFHAEAAVLDLGLPVLDGFELARQIREQFASRAPRLIALTGYGQAHDRERSKRVGFDAHLVKPIDIQSIAAAVERATTSREFSGR